MSQALTLSLKNKPTESVDFGSWYQRSALKRLVNRSDVFGFKKHTEFERSAFLFHQPQALPIAATQAVVDLPEFDSEYFWLCIDPVQMVPDRDTLVMFPPESLAISDSEREQLKQAFNRHFSADGVQIQSGVSGRWYLSLPQKVDIQTIALEQACYRNLHGLFPSGHAAAYWRSLMNEVQMLFFSHPVNQARRDNGQAEINSIWLWGEGKLNLEQVTQRPQAGIFSDALYSKGMAQLTNAAYQFQPANYQAWCSQAEGLEHSLVELNLDWGDNADQVWQSLEESWFEPILQGLQTKKLHSVLLDFTPQQGYLIEPGHLKRFWRWRNRLVLG